MARALRIPLYVAGGFVRDVHLGRDLVDVDLVVEGDAFRFAGALARRLAGKLARHPAFGTGRIVLADGVEVDVAMARRETYRRPGALPQVEPGSIAEDLARRDFAINALAVRLDGEGGPELLDPFGGLDDLRAGRLRILHPRSFIDDPTRILRAARLEARLGFRLAPGALRLARRAVRAGRLREVEGSRLFREFRLALEAPEAPGIFRRLARLGVLAAIHPAFAGRPCARILRTAAALLARHPDLLPEDRRWQARLVALLWGLPAGTIRGLLRRLQAPPPEAARAAAAVRSARRVAGRLGRRPASRPSALCRFLAGMAVEAVVAVAADGPPTARRLARRFLARLRFIESPLDGEDLKALGLPPGPVYRRILEGLRDRVLDRKIRGRGQALKWVAERFGGGRAGLTTPTPSVSVAKTVHARR